MRARDTWLSACMMACLLFVPLLPEGVLAAAKPESSPVRISGVHFDGLLEGTPEPDSAVRLINTDAVRAADVGGFVLTERLTPRRASRRTSHELHVGLGDGVSHDAVDGEVGSARDERVVRIPEGIRIPPGGEIWIAATATGFRSIFGHNPTCEAVNTDLAVTDAAAPQGFLLLPAEHGAVGLINGRGDVVDFVAYELTDKPYFTGSDFVGAPWKGGPVLLRKSSFYGWKGQVLARDRDERGRVLNDTDSAADWDSGFTRKSLGEEPTHRVEIAGQSRFVTRPLRHVAARILATSAPDNNHAALVQALRRAQREILVRIYEMTNPKLVEELIGAKARGVDVRLFLEGAPVGGIADQERWLLDRAARAGISVHFLATPKGSRLKPRYRFDHSKYVLIDGSIAIVGTENYGRTGVPVFNSYGNRGWMVHIENPEFVRQLRDVWNADYQPGVMPDVLSIDASPTDAFGLPYRDAAFVPDESEHHGSYEDPAAPVEVRGAVDLELVLSPDTSLNEHSALIGMIARAKRTLYIEQNSVRRRWGRKADASSSNRDDVDDDDAKSTPNLPLQAVVAAARRGVQVRVLLDGTWYNVQGDEQRDNDDTVAWLNGLARREGLDLVAKIINLKTTHVQKIHAKGVIADGHEVFVGSINWTENSFKGNREVGVVIGHPQVAGYYASLFERDWADSRMYAADVIAQTEVRSRRSRNSSVLQRLARGDRVMVVGEHGKKKDVDGPAWLEVRLARGQTGFVDPGAIGQPEVEPQEGIHILGREATVSGTVAATDVSERRVQLRLEDADRPPFTVVIFKKSEAAFRNRGIDPTSAFQGRALRVRGVVTMYKGPEVIVGSPDQIEIVR